MPVRVAAIAVGIGMAVCGGAFQASAEPKVLTAPDWVQRPTIQDLHRYYPDPAMALGGGGAMIRCQVRPDGRLEACSVTAEDPPGYGFGGAALKLARYFQVRPAGAAEADDPTRESVPADGGLVEIPINFGPPPQPGKTAMPAAPPRLLDPTRNRLACPRAPEPANAHQARAMMLAAVAPLEALQTQRLRAFDKASAGLSAQAADAQFARLQRKYQQERFSVLYPLAARGNGAAAYSIALQYRSADSGFADFKEWLRLVGCASDLGNAQATAALMQWYWHEKGDGSFPAIRRNRAKALDLASLAAEQGDVGGLAALGVYIGAGLHHYPVNPDIGRKIFVLCARGGSDLCKWRLVEAQDQKRSYALQDSRAIYLLLRNQAKAQPARYTARLEAFRSKLSKAEISATEAGPDPWRTASWSALEPEWAVIRQEILANDCPASVSCVLGTVCVCESR